MNRRSCENCAAFSAIENQTFGECRCHAPSAGCTFDEHGNPETYSWPLVSKTSWCLNWIEPEDIDMEAQF
jgi:hypothetical protein